MEAAAGRDVPRVLVARGLRDFADGFVAVLLPVHLGLLGFGPDGIGLVAALALGGSALLTVAVGFAGARLDLRLLLILAAALMAATGVLFAVATAWPLILLGALAGTINPSAGSVSVFVPLEHAVLARGVTDATRTRAFAHYSLVGALAAAAGALAAAIPDLLARLGPGRPAALRAMFALYALLGLAGGAVYAGLARAPAGAALRRGGTLGPSRRLVYGLAALFSLDSFAGGFVVQSLLALWLFERFGLSLAQAGVFFFWSGVLAAFSFPLAARLAGRIGLINTMVWTHLPSSLCLIAAALSPRLDLALALLLVRAALAQMDVPARSSYVMAIVTPAERTAAASITAVPRSLAAAASPAVAGALYAAGHASLPLVLCGGLKILYDLLLLAAFRHRRPPEER